jgi:hypothetical protein
VSVRWLLDRDVAEVDRLTRLDVVAGRWPPAAPTEIPSLEEENTQKPILARVDPPTPNRATARASKRPPGSVSKLAHGGQQ